MKEQQEDKMAEFLDWVLDKITEDAALTQDERVRYGRFLGQISGKLGYLFSDDNK